MCKKTRYTTFWRISFTFTCLIITYHFYFQYLIIFHAEVSNIRYLSKGFSHKRNVKSGSTSLGLSYASNMTAANMVDFVLEHVVSS